MTLYAQLDSRTWHKETITTGGLSLLGHMYGEAMPRHLRGVIGITDLTKDGHSWKAVAHELGHKMNVSHEYREPSPRHEVRADGGLMLYGSVTEIPSGVDGRYSRERLHRSPCVYRVDESGDGVYDPHYDSGGHYCDGLSMDIGLPSLRRWP